MSKGSEWGRRIKLEEIAKRGGQCENPDCNETMALEFHHIKETGVKGHNRGGLNTVARDIRENPDCYMLLCRPCHVREHPDVFNYYNEAQISELKAIEYYASQGGQ